MPTVDLSQYNDPAQQDAVVRKLRAESTEAFQSQRANLLHCLRELKPRTVACLGSGALSDIPLRELLQNTGTVYLIDWVPGLSSRAYQMLTGEWALEGGAPARNPVFLDQDITLGHSAAFCARYPALVQSATDVVQCVRDAQKLAEECHHINQSLPLPDQSIDLVVSSMIVSQFPAYPFGYFRQVLLDKFAAEFELRSAEVRPLMEQLSAYLFQSQIAGHAAELRRLVSSRGRVYFSMEFYHAHPADPARFEYFIPGAYALRLFSDMFLFDIDALPVESRRVRARLPEREVVIESYVMTARG